MVHSSSEAGAAASLKAGTDVACTSYAALQVCKPQQASCFRLPLEA